MTTPNGENMVKNPEEECVLSLLAFQKQEESETPELNANTATSTSKPKAKSRKPAASLPPTPKDPIETLHVTQPPLELPNREAANGTVAATRFPPRATEALPAIYTNADARLVARLLAPPLVAPPLSAPLLPTEIAIREQFWLSAQPPQNGGASKTAKRKRDDAPQESLVPIPPNGGGWDPDKEFDDTTPDAPILPHFPQIGIDELIGGSHLVKKQDRNLVPDALFVAMAQLEPTRLTIADRTGSYRKLDLGFVGFCCKHCGGQPGFGRYFPSTMRSCQQTTSSQTIVKHMNGKCRYVPDLIRNVILELERIHQQKEINNELGRPRYGARKVFFERIWKRLHDYEFPDKFVEDDLNEEPPAEVEKEQTSEAPATEVEKNGVKETAKGKDDNVSNEKTVVDAARENKCRFGKLPTKKNVENHMEGLDGSEHKRAQVVWEV